MFFLLFTSCASQINGTLQSDGRADLLVSASLEPNITRLIRTFATMASGNVQPDAPLLDGLAISASLTAAPGVASASLVNTTPTSIAGPVVISRLSDFLSQDRASGFITFEQGPQGGRCVIRLSRETGPEILALISPEIGEYLQALMAPIATGEVMTRTEYLLLISLVFGRAIADEMTNAHIRASLEFPGQIQNVHGGTFSGRRAEFAVPLLDILVIETPLRYEVTWR